MSKEIFETALTWEYEKLFTEHPSYVGVAKRTTPQEMAHNMTRALHDGTGDCRSLAVKRACRKFGIKPSYKAIHAFFKS